MKKNIKLLVLKSKTRGKLDAGKIRRIATFLTRVELKEYLLLLRQERSHEKVIVEAPLDPNLTRKGFLAFLEKRFKDKEFEFIENKGLIGGLRLKIDNDVLDYSFRTMLEKVI